jgi:hypothetical protein
MTFSLLCVEGEVWRDGRERGARSEAVAGRKRAVEEADGGLELGQGRVAIGDPKKRIEFAVLRATRVGSPYGKDES